MMIPPAAAEAVYHIGNFPITNAMINSWIAVVFFIVLALIIRLRKNLVPKKGFQNFIEALIETALGEVQKVTGDAKRARMFLPIVATIFFFILFSNWFGLVPGTGSIGIYEVIEGKIELLPLLRPAASDLNLTVAIAAFAIFMSHVIGLRAVGASNHISKFLNIRGVIRALKHGPMAVVVAFIELFVGLIEIVSELAKVVSLSLRLFGNIFAGEVLMTVMLGLFSYFLPIPFMFLELLVGIIQATVFAMLTLAYLTVATEAHGHEDEKEHADDHAKQTVPVH